MNTTDLGKCAGALVALAICSACGGGSAVAPQNAGLTGAYVARAAIVNGRPVTAAHPNPNAVPRFLTTVPDGPIRSNIFYPTRQYIINYYSSYASIFKWPKSDQQVGMIDNVGGQGCTNVLYGHGKGIIWIVAGSDDITEFEVPKKPIKTLSVPFSFPSSCAMNSGGNLAVGILYGTSTAESGGQVVIFKGGSGSGTVYKTPLDEEFFDGYDARGNLFADGFTRDRSGFALVELPKGSKTFRKIRTSNSVGFPGSVQWDGKYLTVFDQDTGEIYQYTLSGTKATLKGTVTLGGSGDCAQTWIGIGIVICGDAGNNGGEIYRYPAGGSPIAVLAGSFDLPLGTTEGDK